MYWKPGINRFLPRRSVLRTGKTVVYLKKGYDMISVSPMLQQARDYEREHTAVSGKEERPLFHLTPPVGWMNDPNGFCRYQGQYHLFFQYHPYSLQWGPMHWGHAVSDDLLRLLLDRESVELFINGGERTITALIPSPPEADQILLSADAPIHVSAEAHHLSGSAPAMQFLSPLRMDTEA